MAAWGGATTGKNFLQLWTVHSFWGISLYNSMAIHFSPGPHFPIKLIH
jgi:hypothetical protein